MGSSADNPDAAAGEQMLWDRLRAIEEKLELLTRTIVEPDVPREVKERNLRRRVHVVDGNEETARRARVGRAAKRNKMTYRAWVEKYGMRETDP